MENNKLTSMISICILLSLCFILAQSYITDDTPPNVQDDMNYYLSKDNYNQQELQRIENYLTDRNSKDFNEQDLQLGKKYLSQIKSQINPDAKTGDITKNYLIALGLKNGLITDTEDFSIAEQYYSKMLSKPVEIRSSFIVNEDDSITVGTSTILKIQLSNLALRQDVTKIIIDLDGNLNFESATESYLANNADVIIPKAEGSYIFTGKAGNPAVVTIGDHSYTGDSISITEDTLEIINNKGDITNTFNFNGQDFTATSNYVEGEQSRIFVNKNDDSMDFTNAQFTSSDGKLRNYELVDGQPITSTTSTHYNIKFANGGTIVAKLSASDGYTDPVIYYDGNTVINEDDEMKVVFTELNWPIDDKTVVVNSKEGKIDYDRVRLKAITDKGQEITTFGGKGTIIVKENQLSVGALAGLAKEIPPPNPQPETGDVVVKDKEVILELDGEKLKLLNIRNPPQSQIRREYFLEDKDGDSTIVRVGGIRPEIQVEYPDGRVTILQYPDDKQRFQEMLQRLAPLPQRYSR